MEEALTALLLGHAPLAAELGTRIHWRMQPRKGTAFPYLNLSVISDPRSYHMGGETALRQTRVQADVWAETYSEAKAIVRLLTSPAFLSGYRGTGEGVRFQGIFVGDPKDFTDQTTGEERQLFRISVDFLISWNKEF